MKYLDLEKFKRFLEKKFGGKPYIGTCVMDMTPLEEVLKEALDVLMKEVDE